jgi:DNA helicase IV
MQWIEENVERLKKKKIASEKAAAEKRAADKRIAAMAVAERLKQQKLASTAQRIAEAKNFAGSAAKTYEEGYERRAAKVVARIGDPRMRTYK